MDATTYERAVARASEVVSGIAKEQLDDPTPCGDWKVRDVLNHLIGSFHCISAGSRGEKVDFDHPDDFASGDYVSEFDAASRAAIDALKEDGAMEKRFTMSWGDSPGAMLTGVFTSDTAIHAWDLAQGTGQPYEMDPEVAEASYAHVTSMMEPEGKMPRSGAFGEPIEVVDDASVQDKLLAYTGRKPV